MLGVNAELAESWIAALVSIVGIRRWSNELQSVVDRCAVAAAFATAMVDAGLAWAGW